MDEVNGYRRILFYTNLYDNKGRGQSTRRENL